MKIGDRMANTADGTSGYAPRIAAKVDANTYASELFGPNHGDLSHPVGKAPMVVLTIPGNAAADNPATVGVDETRLGDNHEGSATIEFMLSGGATFAANVTGLLWDSNISEDATTDTDDFDGAAGTAGSEIVDNDFVTAPGTVTSIVSGGRKGDSSITIKIEPAGGTEGTVSTTHRLDYTDAAAGAGQAIAFYLPKLANLDVLANQAGSDKTKKVSIHAVATIISGAFSDGALTGATGATAVQSRDSLTVEMTMGTTKMVGLDDDGDDKAFQYVKGANKDGYVKLGTVTIETKQVAIAAKAAVTQKIHYYIDSTDPATVPAEGENPAKNQLERNSTVFSPMAAKQNTVFHKIYDLDGADIDEGLRGTLTVNAKGTRELFNEGDTLFVDYDGNGMMGGSEGIAISGDTGTGSGLSIDPDRSDSFNALGTGTFDVYYMVGGKEDINHGSTITLTANVDYSDSTAVDEKPVSSTTTLNFDGVNSEVMAYAIPHSTNGTGDKANVRVRCEASAGCRVFVECWDDAGMRSFGRAGMIDGNALVRWDATAIEEVLGIDDPISRHSCRILSAGMVSVQQLTRDGNSHTLVNNTYVGQ